MAGNAPQEKLRLTSQGGGRLVPSSPLPISIHREDRASTVGFYSVLGFVLMTYDTPIDGAVAKEMAERPLSSMQQR